MNIAKILNYVFVIIMSIISASAYHSSTSPGTTSNGSSWVPLIVLLVVGVAVFWVFWKFVLKEEKKF